MTVTVYRSTDAGAPVLSGVQGSMASVLNACLVTGYGSKPSAGWTAPYSATNKVVFRMPAGSNGHYLVVDETPVSGTNYVYAYESMTSATDGNNRFPALSQSNTLGTLLYIRTNAAAGNTAGRPWMLLTNGTCFYFWTNTSGAYPVLTTMPGCRMMFFGQINSKVAGDQYHTLLAADNVYTGSEQNVMNSFSTQINSAAQGGHFMCRNYSQTGQSWQVGKMCDYSFATQNFFGSGGFTVSNPADQRLYVGPVQVVEIVGSLNVWRGTLPGMYNPYVASGSTVFNDGDIVTDVDGFPGKTFEAKFLGSAVCLLETSNTW